jgi:hypothetical protein
VTDRQGIGFGWLQNAWLLHARLKIHRGGIDAPSVASTENPRAGSLRSAAAGAHSVQGLLTTVCESATLHEGHFSDEQKAIECGETLDDQEYGRASFFFFLTSAFHRDLMRRWRPTDAGIAAW